MIRHNRPFAVQLARIFWMLSLLGSAAIAAAAQAPVQPQPYFTDPALSPDGSEIAFVSGGDIWTVPAAGGDAHLLVSHPATESRPLYSPDGRRLAFVSTRTGNGDIYVLTLETGDLKRLTFDDSLDLLDAWSADGRWIYFTSTSLDVGTPDILRVSSEGGTPMQVSGDVYTAEYFAAPSHDGSAIALTGHGIGGSQWWRKGHSHIDESEIWVMRFGARPVYEQVSEGGAKEMWPMWSKDDRTIYYVSDRSGAQNIWASDLTGKRRQVTQFKDGRVLWPSIGADGRTIVFERDFQIWKVDATSGRASAVNILRRGVPAGPAIDHLRLNEGISEMALAPDGKKIAFILRGEIFAVSSSDGGDAARVTNSPADESQVASSMFQIVMAQHTFFSTTLPRTPNRASPTIKPATIPLSFHLTESQSLLNAADRRFAFTKSTRRKNTRWLTHTSNGRRLVRIDRLPGRPTANGSPMCRWATGLSKTFL